MEKWVWEDALRNRDISAGLLLALEVAGEAAFLGRILLIK